MPNWCLNKVDVSGDPVLIRRFKKAVAGTSKDENKQFSFNHITRMPGEYRTTVFPVPDKDKKKSAALKRKYGSTDWYSWCKKNWGTKWDLPVDEDVLEDEEHEKTYGRLCYLFDTASTPPGHICTKLRKMFPDLYIVWFYSEPGNGLAGYL
jgi:muconolactone delta-isomerase